MDQHVSHCRRRLRVEVVGARNLESKQSIDAYCVVRFGGASRVYRSPTVPSNAHPQWSFAAELPVPASNKSSRRLSVHLFNENNFFFDMFPCGGGSGGGGGASDECEGDPPTRSPRDGKAQEVESADEALGRVDLCLGLLCSRSRPVTDMWYLLRGTRSGEVRIKTTFIDENMSNQEATVETSGSQQATENAVDLLDHYGFRIPEH